MSRNAAWTRAPTFTNETHEGTRTQQLHHLPATHDMNPGTRGIWSKKYFEYLNFGIYTIQLETSCLHQGKKILHYGHFQKIFIYGGLRIFALVNQTTPHHWADKRIKHWQKSFKCLFIKLDSLNTEKAPVLCIYHSIDVKIEEPSQKAAARLWELEGEVEVEADHRERGGGQGRM